MYRWIVFVHVLSVLAFMATHGVSIALTFRIRGARTLEDARPILDLSASMLGVMDGAFALVAVSGIAAGIVGQWWRNGWFWVSVVLLAAMVGIMSIYGAVAFNTIRRAAGLPHFGEGRRPQPAIPPDLPAMLRAIDATRPANLAAAGLGGAAVLTWLMMFKPF
ncbi:MAG: hypothetical protein KIS68_16715 [Bauldia sp.]|nr:hypothetical protein [Bauldia sp.]